MKKIVLVGLIALFVLFSGCLGEFGGSAGSDGNVMFSNVEDCRTKTNFIGDPWVEFNTNCHEQVSILKKDIEICNDIRGFIEEAIAENPDKLDLMPERRYDIDYLIDNCKATWYSSLPKTKADLQLCNSAKDEYQATCLTAIAKNLLDTSICDMVQKDGKIYWTETAMNYCYFEIFMITKDEKICESFPQPNDKLKNQCYYSVAIEQEDEKLCNKISIENPTINKNKCFYAIARDKNNENICENILNADFKIACIATVQKDMDLCQTSLFKGLCSYDIEKRV